MRTGEVFIPIIFFLSVAGIWVWIVYTRHRERMFMMEKGLDSKDMKALYERSSKINPLSSLKWGMIFVSIGLAVLVSIWMRENYVMNDGIIPGMMALFAGAGLVGFYLLVNKKVQP